MPTFGSLFSGIGGLDLGLERAGWELKFQVEIDPWCRKVLAKHWPDVPKYGDVREVTAAIPDTESHLRRASGHDGREPSNGSGAYLEPVDLICGGFPCQPVSVAGKRLGELDERWLWPEFARVLRLLRPRYALIENVPGLFHRGFDTVLRDLHEAGFDAEWFCLRASDVGAPHRRERVFIVAYAQRAGPPRTGSGDEPEGAEYRTLNACAEDVADSEEQPIGTGLRQEDAGGQRWGRFSDGDWWAVEPNVGRVANGVPSRVDRLRGLGNAVVPQVAEYIGKQLLEAMQ